MRFELRQGITEELLDAVRDGMADAPDSYMVPSLTQGAIAAFLLPYTVFGGYDETGRCGGAVWFRGKEIHISVAPWAQTKWASRSLLRQFFRAFFAQSDVAEIQATTKQAAKFDEGLGFEFIGLSDRGVPRYRLEREKARFL